MPLAKLCRMLGEMAAANQMPAMRSGRVEQVASHDDGGGADQLASESSASSSAGFASKPISRRPSTTARMAAIHHVNPLQAAGVSRYRATFVRASDKMSGGSKSGKPFQSATFHCLGREHDCGSPPAPARQIDGDLRYRPAERIRHVEPLDDGGQLDVPPVEIDHHLGGACDRAA